MSQSDRPRITGRKTVWEHASKTFRIDELDVEYREAVGKPLKQIQWASFERGDAVAALIVNTDTKNVILVRQLRPPIIGKDGSDGNLVETAAGMIRQNEEPWHALQRELFEETGYDLSFNSDTGLLVGTELIGEFFSSPGGSSEKIYLYYVEVNADTPKSGGGGIKADGESIDPVVMPLSEFFVRHERGEFRDPKILIAGHWLAKRRRNRPPGWRKERDKHDRQEFELKGSFVKSGEHRKQRIVGYCAGDIGKVDDVDIWVNSANTEFLMDSIYHRTLSARIRALGAKKVGDTVVDDTLQRELERALGIGKGIDLGNVLVTNSGALKTSHKVRRLLHVASVKARVNDDGEVVPITGLPELRKCLLTALSQCDQLNARRFDPETWFGKPYRSIILPLVGAGEDRASRELTTRNISEILIQAAIEYLQQHPESKLERVYFLAYKPLEIEIVDSILSRHPSLTRTQALTSGSTTPDDEAPARQS